MSYGAPTLLQDIHQLDPFTCKQPELEVWLKRFARKNHATGASRVFVVASDDQRIVGYYALVAGSVKRQVAPGRVSRNMPEPIPVAVLGRLAVHLDHEGRGIGRGLLQDAVLRTMRVAEEIGVRALLCHAIDAPARDFYIKHGFIGSPIEPMTVMLPLK